MAEELNIEDLKKHLTYDGWWEGRFTFLPGGIFICTNFDDLKTPIEKMRQAKLSTIAISPPTDEQKKITAKQQEIFEERLKHRTKILSDNFLERFKKSQDRARLISSETDKYEKLLFEEKLKLTPGEELNQFNAENRFTPLMGIGDIRRIYKERIVQGKRSFIDLRSPYCRFGMGRDVTEDYILVESFFHYLQWLKDYKIKYEDVQQMISETRVNTGTLVNELALLEKLIVDHSTKTKYWLILKLEQPFEFDTRIKTDDGDEYCPAEVRFFENIFKNEISRVQSAISNHVVILHSTDAKSAYLNLVYSQITGLQEKNRELKERYDKMKAFHTDRIIYGYYFLMMWSLKKSLKEDYKPYLDLDLIFNNTDDKKFEYCILHRYYDQQEEIAKHSNHECKTRINAEKVAAELLDTIKEEYLERYDYLAQKWVKQKKQKGNDVNEKSFILYFLNKMKTLFTCDSSAHTYSASDYQQKPYVFKEDFYNKYMTGIFDFICNDLQKKLSEFDVFNVSEVSKLQDERRETFRESVLPKIGKPDLEQRKTTAREILDFLSGDNHSHQKIMTEQNFETMLNHVYHLIEFEELPAEIYPLPQVNVTNEVLRYTFYRIHKVLYTTKRIKPVWIDFLHKVFKQFENTDWNTTKTKFSVKPSLYETDMKQMVK